MTEHYDQNTHSTFLEECESALCFLDPNCDRESWVTIGMALKNGLGEGGLQIFDAWSSGGDTYSQGDTRDVWRSLSRDGGVTIKTLFKLARDVGWRGSSDDKPPSQGDDRFDCQAFLRKCGLANPRHPYLVAKGIGTHGIWQLGDFLVIPLQDERGTITGLQKIAPDGSKRYHSGTRKKGSFHIIGARFENLGKVLQQGKSLLLCEGFATGATLRIVMESPAVVVFDAGNVMEVAKLFRGLFPVQDIILAADDDWRLPGNPGLTKAEAAARAIGGRLAVPDFGPERQEKETDFNDLAGRLGLDAVRQSIWHAKVVEPLKPEPQEQAPSGPKPFSMADLLSQTFDPVEFTIDTLLAQGVYILGGKPKVGKSWLALHFLLSVTSGNPVFGKLPVSQGQALYISLEDHKRRLFKRVKQIYSASPRDDLFFEIHWPRLGQGCVEELEKWLVNHPETKLIVIDTLAKIRPPRGKNEDLYAGDYAVVSAFKEISERYKTTVILVHHLRKMGSDDPADMLSGTTGLAGGVDGTLVLIKKQGGKTLTLHRSGRDLLEDEPLSLTWDKERGLWHCLDEKIAPFYDVTEEQQVIIRVLKESCYSMNSNEISEKIDKSPDSIRKILNRMVEKGIVIKIGKTPPRFAIATAYATFCGW